MSIWGERIKALRKKANLRQYHLAGKIGIDASTVSRWESGEIRPSIEELIKIANQFGVSVDFLVGRTDWEIDFSKVDPGKRKLIEEYMKFIDKK
jgi:transcriptional regulator with XRE-family HTH domain